MNWLALIGVAAFAGALVFGFRTGTMPIWAHWSPYREDEPGWFWAGAAIHALLFAASLAGFLGLLR